MAGLLTIGAHVLGQRKPLVPDYGFPLPSDFPTSGESLTLRELITRIVQEEVRAFEKRQEQRKLVHILTEGQIAAGMQSGRVDPGGRDLKQQVNVESAVDTALQAFKDGLYLVVLDGEEQRELDRQVWLSPESRLTFVRLTFLAEA